jgi:hypothetical protein
MKNILTMLDAAKAFIGLAFSPSGVTIDAAGRPEKVFYV